MGGSYFISPECIRRLYRNNLLARQEIRWCELQEDWIFGLLIYSVGLKHGDFATGHFPMGLRWRGLPCSPEELLTPEEKTGPLDPVLPQSFGRRDTWLLPGTKAAGTDHLVSQSLRSEKRFISCRRWPPRTIAHERKNPTAHATVGAAGFKIRYASTHDILENLEAWGRALT